MSACKRAHQDGIVHFLLAHLRPGPLCALCEDIALLEHARAPNRCKGALAFVCAVSEVAKDGAGDTNAAGILGCVVGLVGSKLIGRRLPPQRLPVHAAALRLISVKFVLQLAWKPAGEKRNSLRAGVLAASLHATKEGVNGRTGCRYGSGFTTRRHEF